TRLVGALSVTDDVWLSKGGPVRMLLRQIRPTAPDLSRGARPPCGLRQTRSSAADLSPSACSGEPSWPFFVAIGQKPPPSAAPDGWRARGRAPARRSRSRARDPAPSARGTAICHANASGDDAVRSIAGSTVEYDCTLSRNTAPWPLKRANASPLRAGQRRI